jgi:hypothetical protein
MGSVIRRVSRVICRSLWLFNMGLQSKMKIHLSRLNSSNYTAVTNSTTFSPANIRFGFLATFLFSKICISSVMRLGHIVLNILFKALADSRIIKMRMQKRMRISKAGWEV